MEPTQVDLFLEFQTESHDVSLRIPVLPSALEFERSSDNASSSTIRLGEVNVLRRPKLISFTIDSFFPKNNASHFVRGRDEFYTPDYYATLLTYLQDSRVPAKAVFAGLEIESFYVSVESFKFRSEFGDADMGYQLSLKEYRHYGASANKLVTTKPIFSGDHAQAVSGVGPARPKTEFSIGDRVVVNGTHYRDPYGGVAFLPTPIDFMCQNYQTALAKGIQSLRNAPAALYEQAAVIIGIKCNGNQLIKSSLPGQLETKTELEVFFPYRIAVNERALGWVEKSSLRHQ